MDTVDLRILVELARDSRLSVRRLASLLGMPHTTVYARMKKLEERRVVRRYTVDINPEALGYDITAIVSISVDGSVIEEVEEDLARIANVIAVYDVTGDFDIMAIARFRSIGELDRFIKWLNKHPGVKKTLTSIAFRVVKEDPTSVLDAGTHPAPTG